MKTKMIFASLAVAAMAMTSCGKGSGSSVADADVKTFEDSVAMFNGVIAGTNALDIYASLPDSLQKQFDKDQFIAGMKYILESDTTSNFRDGMTMGLQVMGMVQQAGQVGVKLDPAIIMSYFAKTFKADSISTQEREKLGPEIERVMGRFQEIIQTAQYEQQVKMQAQMQMMVDKNLSAGKAFVDEKKAKDPEIKTTESGLSYKVEKQGTGAVAKDGGEAKVIYVGKHIDGKVFDSSENQVVTFKVNEVVPGFAEALKLFPAGSKVTLYVPSEIGYGMNGAPGIEPGETLVFEVEVVE